MMEHDGTLDGLEGTWFWVTFFGDLRMMHEWWARQNVDDLRIWEREMCIWILRRFTTLLNIQDFQETKKNWPVGFHGMGCLGYDILIYFIWKNLPHGIFPQDDLRLWSSKRGLGSFTSHALTSRGSCGEDLGRFRRSSVFESCGLGNVMAEAAAVAGCFYVCGGWDGRQFWPQLNPWHLGTWNNSAKCLKNTKLQPF